MKMLVCMKQVACEAVGRLAGCNREIRDANPADLAALEMALTIKEQAEGSITVLTIGRESAENLLLMAAGFSVDELALVTGNAFAGSDTLATAKTIAAAVCALGDFDLIFMGKSAVDGETGHVGPETAALLGRTCIANAVGVSFDGEHFLVKKLLEDRELLYMAEHPLVVTVCGGAGKLRPPGILEMKKARSKTILRLSNEDLGLSEREIGICGSPTTVIRVSEMERAFKNPSYYRDPKEGAAAILEFIGNAQVLQLASNDATFYKRGRKVKGLHGVCGCEGTEKERLAFYGLVSHALQSGCEVKGLLMNLREEYSDLYYAKVLCKEALDLGLDSLVMPATIRFKAIGPMAAALLDTGMTADCVEIIYEEDGCLLQKRPAFSGTQLAEIKCRTRPQMASVREDLYTLSEHEEARLKSHLKILRIEEKDLGPERELRVIEQRRFEKQSLLDAEGIVAGGGVIPKEGFELLGQLSKLLNFQLGASRTAVDRGNAEYFQQVGQTGITVKPRIYMAFGISGAVQHLVGMKDAGGIIAINMDEKAPIFRYADIAVCADWKETAEALLKFLYEK